MTPGPRPRGDRGEHAAEHEAAEREMAGQRDRHAEHAEDAAADHPADRHRGRVGNAQQPVAAAGVRRPRVVRTAPPLHQIDRGTPRVDAPRPGEGKSRFTPRR